jgi:hypothetical protein
VSLSKASTGPNCNKSWENSNVQDVIAPFVPTQRYRGLPTQLCFVSTKLLFADPTKLDFAVPPT